MGGDGCPGLGESNGDGRAHASGRAGDERNLVVETESIEDVWHMRITLRWQRRGGQTRAVVGSVLIWLFACLVGVHSAEAATLPCRGTAVARSEHFSGGVSTILGPVADSKYVVVPNLPHQIDVRGSGSDGIYFGGRSGVFSAIHMHSGKPINGNFIGVEIRACSH